MTVSVRLTKEEKDAVKEKMKKDYERELKKQRKIARKEYAKKIKH